MKFDKELNTSKTDFGNSLYKILILLSFQPNLLGCFFFKDFIYLLLERGREGERNISVQDIHRLSPLTHPQAGDLALQPRHVPWPGTELVTLWFAGRRSTHWATPARAAKVFYWQLNGLPNVCSLIMLFALCNQRGLPQHAHTATTRFVSVTGPHFTFSLCHLNFLLHLPPTILKLYAVTAVQTVLMMGCLWMVLRRQINKSMVLGSELW